MKTLPNAISIFLLVLFGTLASGSAMAQHHGHGGGYYGHGGGVRFGIGFGVPFYGPAYYPYAPYPAYGYPAPAYGYPPVAVAPYAPQEYVEQGNAMSVPPAYADQGNPMTAPPPPPAASVQSQGNWWHYCTDSKGFYPYVRECPSGWQRVSPQPPAS
jgi:hypothetical protein